MATGLLPAAMMMGQVVLGGVAAAPHCEQRSSLVPPALSRGAPNGLGFVPDARMVLASGFTLGWRSVLVTVVICGTGDDPLSRLTITLGVHVVGGAGSLGLAARWTGTLR